MTSDDTRIGILSRGIWRNRATVETLLEGRAVRAGRPFGSECDLIAGWGHKPSAESARRLSAELGLPYVAMEDGFLRSVRPGVAEPALGWIVDRSGIYYDASGPSDLETAIRSRAADGQREASRARSALETIRRARLSKYNHAPMLSLRELGLSPNRDFVLVVDQTRGDASVSGAGVDGGAFLRMLDAAISENPGVPVVVKIHPETIGGAKRGHLLDAAKKRGAHLVARDVNPWALIESARRVYVVSSQFGLEATLAGIPVVCFGAAAFAGWGLTDDRGPEVARRDIRIDRETLAAAVYFDYCRWIDPWEGHEIDFEGAADRLAFLRDRHFENRGAVCVGFSRWKRKAVRSFLTGAGGAPVFVGSTERALEEVRRRGGDLVVWGSRPVSATANVPVVRAEDGFLRSVGLGAAFVRPASLVFDDIGIYYDPTGPSRLEVVAQNTTFDAELLARAATLRQMLVDLRLSKYNVDEGRRLALPKERECILVPGQVEDDASIRLGTTDVTTNLDLLRAVRLRRPNAHLIFKPHPDVEAGLRKGRIPIETARQLADDVVTDVSMPSLLAQIDRVETMTSLTGFEALLRGIPVSTYGMPFYAGWGLTDDTVSCSRRTRRLTLDELVAAALLVYPRYVDPLSGLPCPVEVIVRRLDSLRRAADTPLGRLRNRSRTAYAWIAHNFLGRLVEFTIGKGQK